MPPTHPELIEDSYAYQELLGFTFVDWTEDRAVIEVPIAEKLGNRYGIPHGGVHASLLDTAMGYSGCFSGDPARKILAMTLTLNVSYLAQVQGTKLICEATKTGGGKRTFFSEGTLTDDLGTLVARSSGAFRYRSPC